MSSSRSPDPWVSSKILTPAARQGLAQIRSEVMAKIGAEIGSLAEAKRAIDGATSFPDFYAALDRMAEASRNVAHLSHCAKAFCDWEIPPAPEFNDHFINQFYFLSEFKRTFWLEGAVFCGLGLERGQRVLELCCGSGYYTSLFYSPFASEIVAVDFDPRAIEVAKKHFQAPNVRYEVMDIRKRLPDGPFHSVIWDGAIEHFTTGDIDAIMYGLRLAMVENGRLLGYTVAEPADAPLHPDHETHFDGMASLGHLLKRHFKNVRVFERVHPTINPLRHNLFFYASDGPLPFDPDWEHGLRL